MRKRQAGNTFEDSNDPITKDEILHLSKSEQEAVIDRLALDSEILNWRSRIGISLLSIPIASVYLYLAWSQWKYPWFLEIHHILQRTAWSNLLIFIHILGAINAIFSGYILFSSGNEDLTNFSWLIATLVFTYWLFQSIITSVVLSIYALLPTANFIYLWIIQWTRSSIAENNTDILKLKKLMYDFKKA